MDLCAQRRRPLAMGYVNVEGVAHFDATGSSPEVAFQLAVCICCIGILTSFTTVSPKRARTIVSAKRRVTKKTEKQKILLGVRFDDSQRVLAPWQNNLLEERGAQPEDEGDSGPKPHMENQKACRFEGESVGAKVKDMTRKKRDNRPSV